MSHISSETVQIKTVSCPCPASVSGVRNMETSLRGDTVLSPLSHYSPQRLKNTPERLTGLGPPAAAAAHCLPEIWY